MPTLGSWKRHTRTSAWLLAALIGSSITGCAGVLQRQVEYTTVEPQSYPKLIAVGYAPISKQAGFDRNDKMLMAMKASKLDAYRELAEQVYGQRISGQQSLSDMVLSDSSVEGKVEGIVRGATVLRSYPVDNDTYVTELELDMARVRDLFISVTKPQKVDRVLYY